MSPHTWSHGEKTSSIHVWVHPQFYHPCVPPGLTSRGEGLTLLPTSKATRLPTWAIPPQPDTWAISPQPRSSLQPLGSYFTWNFLFTTYSRSFSSKTSVIFFSLFFLPRFCPFEAKFRSALFFSMLCGVTHQLWIWTTAVQVAALFIQ